MEHNRLDKAHHVRCITQRAESYLFCLEGQTGPHTFLVAETYTQLRSVPIERLGGLEADSTEAFLAALHCPSCPSL